MADATSPIKSSYFCIVHPTIPASATQKKIILTKRQQILQRRLVSYCRRLGLGTAIPEIIWSRKEYKKFSSLHIGLRVSKHLRGSCFRLANKIFINYYGTNNGLVHFVPSLDKMDYYLRHELIHYRFPKLNHGKKFEQEVEKLKNPNKFWPYFDRFQSVEDEISRQLEISRDHPERSVELAQAEKELRQEKYQRTEAEIAD